MSEPTKARPGLQQYIKENEVKQSNADLILKNAFWYPVLGKEKVITPNGVEVKEIVKDIAIDLLMFYDFLYNQGFRRFEFNDDSIYIKIVNNRIVKKVKKVAMMDAVFNFLDLVPDIIQSNGFDLEKKVLKSCILKRLDLLFNDARILSQLRPKEPIIFNQDTINTKFMYFNNGYLLIDKTNINFKTYDTLEFFIWESQVFKYDYSKPTHAPSLNYIKTFCYNVSGQNETRLKSLMNIIGYSIHNFTNYKLKSLAFTDSIIDQDGEANGRSGKTLLAKIIGGAICSNPYDQSIKTFVEINGKDFDPNDKHKYDLCDLNTQLIVLNDVKKWFDVDSIYNDITEGANVNKKSLQPFRINAKLIVITNKTLKIEGDSSKDRFVEFEFSNYYNANNTPEKDFKHWFFRDWKPDDYNRYYYFMAECAQEFFKNDSKLVQPEQINLHSRKLLDLTSPDFVDFIDNDIRPKHGVEYDKQVLYNKFLETFPDWKNNKRFAQRTFTTWLKYFINYRDEWQNFTPENETRNAAGVRCFIFLRKK